MKTFKRIISLLLVGILLLGLMTSCAEPEEEPSSSSEAESSGTTYEIPADGVYNVREYGAAGDGVQVDSPYIQQVADMIKEQGGGTIIIPEGKYLCGSIRLYSNTKVVLEKGCEMIVSDNEELYSALRGKYDQIYSRDSQILVGKPEDQLDTVSLSYLQGARGATDTLFFAQGAENITLTGEGKINGQCEKFFDMEDAEGSSLSEMDLPSYSKRLGDGIVYEYGVLRPQMMEFLSCSNITVSDITIENSAYYNVHVVICNNVNVSNVTIKNDIHCPNTDGVNMYNCNNVNVENCDITTGDDCIAISGNCRDVNIDNVTVFGSTCFTRIFNGIDAYFKFQLGIGSEAEMNSARLLCAENVNITNCNMKECGAFLVCDAAFGTVRNITVKNSKGTQKENGTGIFLLIQEDGKIENVDIDNFDFEGTGALTLMGNKIASSIKNVSVRNSDFTVNPKTKIYGNGMPDPVTFYNVHYITPYNVYIRHASNILFDNVNIKWGKDDLDSMKEMASPLNRTSSQNLGWQEYMNPDPNFPAFDVGDVVGLTLKNVTAEGHGDAETVRLNTVGKYSDDNDLDKTEINDGRYTLVSSEYGEGKTLKILGIGNSFTQDMLEYAWEIANNLGYEDVMVEGLIIAGSTMNDLYNNMKNDDAVFDHEVYTGGGLTVTNNCNAKEVIQSQQWDIITIQEYSLVNGSDYDKLVENYSDLVKGWANPEAKLYWTFTWGYDPDDTFHTEFAELYGSDPLTMYNALSDFVQTYIVPNDNFEGIIPTGTVIQNLRSTYLADRLTRDTFHMSFDIGRLAHSMNFIHTVTGAPVEDMTFLPDGVTEEDRLTIVKAINAAHKNMFEATDIG